MPTERLLSPEYQSEFRKRFIEDYEKALRNPTETRQELQKKLNSKFSPPVFFSPERAMHVISRSGSPETPKVVVANGGCFEYNSEHTYPKSIFESGNGDVEEADIEDGPLMYGFTKPGDRFVIKGGSETPMILDKVNESFQAIGINLGDIKDCAIVENLTKYMWDKLSEENEFAFHVLSARALLPIARNTAELNYFANQAILHASLYSKRGFEELCRTHGLPTPKTIYQKYNSDNVSGIADEIRQEFPNTERWVVTKDEGVGGRGVHKNITHAQLSNGFLGEYFQEGETIMTQRQLQLLNNLSPCARFYIDAKGVHFMGATAQRFSDPEGTRYAGNEWFLGMEEKIHPLFMQTNYEAAKLLQQSGFIGVNNMDTLIISDIEATNHNEPSQVLLREHNGRPAMSAIISRIQRGNINGLPITRIHSSTNIEIPEKVFHHPNFINKINNINPNVIAIVGTRYPSENGKTYLLFCGNNMVSRDELNKTESDIISLINGL